MSDKIDSSNWTGDVEGRARTQVHLSSPEVLAEIRQTLKWGVVAGSAIMLFAFVLKELL